MSGVPDAGLYPVCQRFRRFSDEAGDHGSLLYRNLAERLSRDPEILRTASGTPITTVPNLFFAAVHYLLLTGAVHALSDFYPSVRQDRRPRSDPYPVFREFCLAHADEIRHLISSRLLQTNEVRRCACLLPVFGLVSAIAPDRPLVLIEVGSSAGLNLLWDRYAYDYGDGAIYGDAGSRVRLVCRVRGEARPPIPSTLPDVRFRVGIDLSPVDVTDPDAFLWLRALIWPEHAERRDLLRCAARIAEEHPPELVQGDALDELPRLFKRVPRGAALCVFHTQSVLL